MEAVAAELASALEKQLGPRLLGLYLFGSLASDDFDSDISDIDLLAVLDAEVDGETFEELRRMHAAFIERYRAWEDRLDIVYISADALRAFGERPARMAVISPGDGFTMQDADPGWTMNWYAVQEQGRTLTGPPPATFIRPIAREEFIATVRESARGRPAWLDHKPARKAQAYVILTMCRALYAVRHGAQTSKRRAAEWAAAELPEWAPLIRNALAWRTAWRDEHVDHAATLDDTRRFVQFMVERIAVE